MAEAGLAIEPWLIASGDCTIEGGIAAGDRILAVERPPSAIFAVNDEMALGIMRAARRRGLGIPDDLSVAGMDDIPMAMLAEPPLTTMRVDCHGLGQKAAEMLIGLVQKTYAGPTRITLPPKLIVRESCRQLVS